MKSAAHLVPLILALISTACVKEPNYPIANLNYIGTTSSTMGFKAELRFTSDYDLNAVFTQAENISKTHEALYCSFEDPAIFDRQHEIPAYIYGSIERESTREPEHLYKVKLQFEEVGKDGSTHVFRKERAMILAAGRPSIPCKVKMNAWGYDAYYSNEFQLPIADFINLLPIDASN